MLQQIEITGFGTLNVSHLVFDYNGTIACDGVLHEGLGEVLQRFSNNYSVHVITSDTFGSVKAALAGMNVTLKVLTSDDHTTEKEAYVKQLGTNAVVAFGNGNNDAKMLKAAQVGIAILGSEGCATAALLASDIVCANIDEAMMLIDQEKRFIATLRK